MAREAGSKAEPKAAPAPLRRCPPAKRCFLALGPRRSAPGRERHCAAFGRSAHAPSHISPPPGGPGAAAAAAASPPPLPRPRSSSPRRRWRHRRRSPFSLPLPPVSHREAWGRAGFPSRLLNRRAPAPPFPARGAASPQAARGAHSPPPSLSRLLLLLAAAPQPRGAAAGGDPPQSSGSPRGTCPLQLSPTTHPTAERGEGGRGRGAGSRRPGGRWVCRYRTPGGDGRAGAGCWQGTRVAPLQGAGGGCGSRVPGSWGVRFAGGCGGARQSRALAAGCVIAKLPRLVPDEKGLICIREI